MTRRQVVTVVVVAVVSVVVPVVLLVAAVRSVLPSSARAQESAQEAADRVAPGGLRVTSAQWRGEAGGYQVIATLTGSDTTISWTGDKRCEPDSICEERLRVALASARDGAAERAAITRGFAACGVPLARIGDVVYDSTAALVGRRDIGAGVTVTVPAADLDGAGRRRVAERLDACLLAWAAQREGLLPVMDVAVSFRLADPDGTEHTTTAAGVDRGRFRVSAGDRMSPVRDAAAYAAFVAAVDPPVRAFLLGQGVVVSEIGSVRSFYAAGTTRRLDIEVNVSQRGADPWAQLPSRTVALTVDDDGSDPTDVRMLY